MEFAIKDYMVMDILSTPEHVIHFKADKIFSQNAVRIHKGKNDFFVCILPRSCSNFVSVKRQNIYRLTWIRSSMHNLNF